MKFPSVIHFSSIADELIDAIKHDISESEKYLDDEKYVHLKSHSFFGVSDQIGVGDSRELKPTSS